MEPYAIFMDIDGTLIDRTQIPTPATVTAIAKYRKFGHQFFIASGRPLFSATAMAERIAPHLNVIGANGSITAVNGQITSRHFTLAALIGIYRISAKYGIRTHFFTPERVIFLDAPQMTVSWDARNRIAGEDPSKNVMIHSEAELQQYAAEITNGFSFAPDTQARTQAKAAMAALPDVDVSSSNTDNIEITAHGVNKASAIKAVCRQLEIPLAHTMAFGDGDNDLQMLTTVHYGVAMGNANPRVKAAVHYHTTDIHHDGVATYLDQFFG
ncbi:Cof-type HAD-IIB family hydrolase [Lacticaseibacillus sp. GG6-2]